MYEVTIYQEEGKYRAEVRETGVEGRLCAFPVFLDGSFGNISYGKDLKPGVQEAVREISTFSALPLLIQETIARGGNFPVRMPLSPRRFNYKPLHDTKKVGKLAEAHPVCGFGMSKGMREGH